MQNSIFANPVFKSRVKLTIATKMLGFSGGIVVVRIMFCGGRNTNPLNRIEETCGKNEWTLDSCRCQETS